MSEHEQPGSEHGHEGDPQGTPFAGTPATPPTAPADAWSQAPTGPVPTGAASTDPTPTDPTPTDPAGSASAGWPGYNSPTWTGSAYPTTAFPEQGQQEPGYQGSGYSQPGYQQPGYPQPGYQGSGYSQPGYPGPGYQQTTPHPAWAPGGATMLPPAEPARRSGRLKLGVAGLVAGALIGGGAGAGVVALLDHQTATTTAGSASAQNVVIKDPTNATSATAAAAKAAPSVVTIYVTNGQGAGSGSSSDGYVLTNNHVVTLEGSGTGTVQVRTADGAMFDADVVGTDSSADLAVVKLKGASGLKPATFADSDKVQVGDLAVAIGAPLGLSNTVTDGIISATNRAVETGSTQTDATVIDAIQTDAAINPGNSGGALVDADGQVVGINTAIASVASESTGSQDTQSGNIGVGFAIPANTAKRIGQEIVKTGKATHAVLGVSARTAADGSNPEAGTGAEIVQVQGGGPADAAGLKSGDVITAVGDRVVTSSTELTAAIRSSTPGSKVTLTVRSGNSSRKVDVTLATTS